MGRTEDTINDAVEILAAGLAVKLDGPPGCGKSECASPGGDLHTKMAERVGVDPSEYGYRDMRPCTDSVENWAGFPWPNRDTGKVDRFMPSSLPTDPCSFGLINIEEINNAPKQWQPALYQFIQEGGIGEYSLPPGWSIMATGNRAEDGCGVGKMSAALLDRFISLNFLPDAEDWRNNYAKKKGVDYRVIAATQWQPDLIETFDGTIKGAQSTSRSITAFARVLESSGLNPTKVGKGSVDQRIYRIAAGALGEEDAARVAGFLGIFSRLPDIDAILSGASEAVPVPVEVDIQIASVAQLAKMSEPANIGNVLRWIDRNSDTMKIVFASDIEGNVANAIARDTVDYRDWRIANAKLFR